MRYDIYTYVIRRLKVISDFTPYIENYVQIMGSHIVSTLKAHDL